MSGSNENIPMSSIGYGTFRIKWIAPTALFVYLGPVLYDKIVIDKGTGPMDINLGDNQNTNVHVQPLDDAGEPGTFTLPPTFAISDTTIATITPSGDGLSCNVRAASPPKLGTATLTVTDNDNPSITPLTFNVIISAEAVTHLGFTVDPPEENTPLLP